MKKISPPPTKVQADMVSQLNVCQTFETLILYGQYSFDKTNIARCKTDEDTIKNNTAQ